MKKLLLFLSVLVFAMVLAACGDGKDDPAPAVETDGVKDGEAIDGKDADSADPSKANEVSDDELSFATVDLMNSDGKSVGTAELTEEDRGVRVKVNATDLPEGLHGFHFHEVGKCEAPDFESAGGHFNPTGASHGLEEKEGPHAGDLPNLEVGEDGTVKDEFLAEQVTLESGKDNSLLQVGGTALVIHAEANDGKTQPSGDSGDRIACGIVE
ncbi:MAG: superoxide dismutase family protein [Sporosarcina sp.]